MNTIAYYDGDRLARQPHAAAAFEAQRAAAHTGRGPLPVLRYAAQPWRPLLTAGEVAAIHARLAVLEAAIDALPDDAARKGLTAEQREWNRLKTRLADDASERRLQAMPPFRGQRGPASAAPAPARATPPAPTPAAPPATAARPPAAPTRPALTGAPLTADERWQASYHEAGHAIVALAAGDVLELLEVYDRHASDGTFGRCVTTSTHGDPTWLVAQHRAGHVAETLLARARGGYVRPREDFTPGRDEARAADVAALADGLAVADIVRRRSSPTFDRGTVVAFTTTNRYAGAVHAVAAALHRYGSIPPEEVCRLMGH